MNSYTSRIFNELLPFVKKPGRYVGNEFNVISKDWKNLNVTFALIFPELYELGMSYQGFDILYHILNRETDLCAERVFAPDEDMDALLRSKNIPLFSLETKKPLPAFDILGFTYQYELHVTNILNILDLGQIPLLAVERDDSAPLVVLGGPCAYNPEPLADFVDVVVLGDGEAVVLEVADVIRQAKQNQWNRQEKLRQLSKIPGVYIPQFYQVEYTTDNQIKSFQPIDEQVPAVIDARIIPHLEPQNYSPHPIVPIIEITHDRVSLEIMRGCSRGCRFCNAGMIYRPVRERPVADLMAYASQVLENTGYEELSLVSLSSSDYSRLKELIVFLTKFTAGKQVRLSFPSLRPETFTSEIARLASGVKKSGLTLAPEAGTERLRKVINKNNSNADLLRAVEIAFEHGWQLIKLYFMLGQPTETDEDLTGITNLLLDVIKLAKKFGNRKLNVSLSPFVPKPHTPFQWEAQDSIEQLNRKIQLIRRGIRYRNLNFSWRDPEVAIVEGVIARGNRLVGKAILNAWQAGARFDAWTHKFSFDTWQAAIETANLQIDSIVGQKQPDEILPWHHLKSGISNQFLLKEQQKAYQAEETEDCRRKNCHGCGLMQQPACKEIQAGKKSFPVDPSQANLPTEWGRGKLKKYTPTTDKTCLIRIKYARGNGMRFFSHLDMIRLFERVLRRADIPILYSQGFHPHPKMSFAPPLALGCLSDAEYLDLNYRFMPEDELFQRLKAGMKGLDLDILQKRLLYGKVRSLNAVVNRIDYDIQLPENIDLTKIKGEINRFHQSASFPVSRLRKGQVKSFDIAPYIKELTWESSSPALKLGSYLENGKTVRIDEVLSHVLKLDPNQKAQCLIRRKEMHIEYGDLRITPMEI